MRRIGSVCCDPVKYRPTSIPATMSKLSAATPREIGGSEHKVEADSMKISTAPQTRDKDVKYWSGQLAETKLSSEHWRTLLQSMCAELNVSENDFAESMNSAYQQVAGGLKQRDVKSECNKTTESMLSVFIIV